MELKMNVFQTNAETVSNSEDYVIHTLQPT